MRAARSFESDVTVAIARNAAAVCGMLTACGFPNPPCDCATVQILGRVKKRIRYTTELFQMLCRYAVPLARPRRAVF
jgi:hypothetical protein